MQDRGPDYDDQVAEKNTDGPDNMDQNRRSEKSFMYRNSVKFNVVSSVTVSVV